MAGWEVDYVPTLSSPLDLIGGGRHARLKRAWARPPCVLPVQGMAGLREWSLRSPYPAHRWFLRHAWQLHAYGCLLPRALTDSCFDVLIADVAPNMLLLPRVKARIKICRLNDWPWGFGSDLQPVVIQAMEEYLRRPFFDEVWAVSRPLERYCRNLNTSQATAYLPNGVDVMVPPPQSHEERGGTGPQRFRSNRAVYLGGMTSWVDWALLIQVALKMPDWTFDFYGPGWRSPSGCPANLRWRGVIDREAVPQMLQGYAVGLIPFQDDQGRMQFVERPMKFYEYVVSGLGVASTDWGALRQGMGDYACYGNGADGFAQAVRNAALQGERRSRSDVEAFAREHSWQSRAQQMFERLAALKNP